MAIHVLKLSLIVQQDDCPPFVHLDFVNQMGLKRGYNVLRLPLSSDGTTVDMVLIVSDYGGDYRGLAEFFEGLDDRR